MSFVTPAPEELAALPVDLSRPEKKQHYPGRYVPELAKEKMPEKPKEKLRVTRAIFRGLRSFSGKGGHKIANVAQSKFNEAQQRRIEEKALRKEVQARLRPALIESRVRQRIEDEEARFRKYGLHPYRTRVKRVGVFAAKRFAKAYLQPYAKKKTGKSGYPAVVFPSHGYGKKPANPTWQKLEFG